MNLPDSCAWMEYLGDGPNADAFAAAIEETDQVVVPTLVIYEVFKRVHQLAGEEVALEAAGTMLRGAVVDLSAGLALEAARLSIDTKLPLADSIILATARQEGAVLWTQDSHFESIEGVRYVPAVGERADLSPL